MKLRSILSEGYRDTVSGTSRALVFFGVLCGFLVLLVVIDCVGMNRLLEQAREFRERGAATLIVISESGIDGRACEAIAQVDGVLSAGAIRSSSEVITPTLLRGSPIPVHAVSEQFLTVLGAAASGAGGLYVSNDVWTALGHVDGSRLAAESGSLPIGGVFSYPTDGRRSGLGWAAVNIVDSTDPFDECWVSLWPPNPDIRPILLSSLAIDAGNQAREVVIEQLNAQLGTAFNGATEFKGRIGRFAPLVVAIFAFVLALTAVRVRRLELASRLHDGMNHVDLTCLLILEHAAWALPAAMCASAVSAVLASTNPIPDARVIGVTAMMAAVTALVSTLAGTALAVMLVRERQYFAYFKDR